MPTSCYAKARTALKAIADATSGFSAARNKLGLDDLVITDTFLKSLVADGPYLLICPAKIGPLEVPIGDSMYEVKAKLYFGIAGDTDYDFTAIEDLIYALKTNALIADAWVTAGGTIPQRFEIDEPNVQTDVKPIIGVYIFTFHFTGC